MYDIQRIFLTLTQATTAHDILDTAMAIDFPMTEDEKYSAITTGFSITANCVPTIEE